MIKLYYHNDFFEMWSSELVLLYKNLVDKVKIDDDRFDILKNYKQPFEYVDDIKMSDYVVLPYKWRGLDVKTQKILEDCATHNKKILIFFNDDSYEEIPITSEQGYIFRTSFFKSSKKDNEFALPAFIDDRFNHEFIKPEDIELTVGFCGFDHYERRKSLELIKYSDKIKCDFIIRKSFWAGEIDKEKAILDFNENLKSNLFNFSSRGAGNFSYRFYEILSMGRIPILLNTDCVLPFEEFFDYSKNCLIINITEINKISEIICQYYQEKTKEDLLTLQLLNRKFYEDTLSPIGFINNLHSLLLLKNE
jgi:hypothetical protein